MDVLLQYRGNTAPTVRHLVEMMSFTRWYLASGLRVLYERLDHRLQDLDAQNREGFKILSQMCGYASARKSSADQFKQTTKAQEPPVGTVSWPPFPPTRLFVREMSDAVK